MFCYVFIAFGSKNLIEAVVNIHPRLTVLDASFIQ